MSEQFKVGEIVIFQFPDTRPELHNEECEVVGELKKRPIGTEIGEFLRYEVCYQVRFRDELHLTGLPISARPNQLRRKPPQQDLTAWAASKVEDITKPVNVPDQVPA